MKEFSLVIKVWFSAFVFCCTLKSVGPGYANALKHEASHSYTAEEVQLNILEVEETKK
jgi:hypothetical protein